MIKAFLTFISIITITCHAQEIECQYPPSGNYTGTCETFYFNGKIRSQTNFVNSVRHGEHIEYYKDGQIAATATFYQEQYIGKAYRYSRDSTVLLEMDLDSTETGKFIYYSEDGKGTLVTGQFKNGFRDGKWLYYNESGELINSSKYDSDKTYKKVYGNKNSNTIIIPYDETVDKLFLEEYGIPVEVHPKKIIEFPDISPKFPPTDGTLQDFINKTVKYPATSIEKSEEGTVYLSFIVELDGSLSDISVLRGVSKSLDEEAIRVIKIMPNWIPGIYNEQNVRTRCRIPIVFTIEKNSK